MFFRFKKSGERSTFRSLRTNASTAPCASPTLALSHAPSQTPASAPIEALTRYDLRSGLHP